MFVWIKHVPPKLIGGQKYVRIKDDCFGEIQVPRKRNFDTYACLICTVVEEYKRRNRNVTPNLIKCFQYITAKWSVHPEMIIEYLENNVHKLDPSLRMTQVYLPLMKKSILPRLRGKKWR